MKKLIMILIASTMLVSPGWSKNNSSEKRWNIWIEDSNAIFNIIGELNLYKINNNDTTLQAQNRKDQLVKKTIEINKKFFGKTLYLQRVKLKDVSEEIGIRLSLFKIMVIEFNKIHKKITGKILVSHAKLKIIYNKMVKAQKNSKEKAFYLNKKEKKLLYKLYSLSKNKHYKHISRKLYKYRYNKKYYGKTGVFNAIYIIPIPLENISTTDDGKKYKNINIENGIFINKYKTMEIKIKMKLYNKEKALSLSKNKYIPLKGKIRKIIYNNNSYMPSAEIIIE